MVLEGKLFKFRGGKWTWDKSGRPQSSGRRDDAVISQLEEEKAALERQADTILDRFEQVQEERNILAFKVQVLTEMLATSQLDAERMSKELADQSNVVEALKWQLAKQSLHTFDE
jgi:septal ring factor EnvC (AmiA/AmiB activator)